jgi:hypothetical protein
VKPLGIEGEGDLKDGFTVVRLALVKGQRRATLDHGVGEVPAMLPDAFVVYKPIVEGTAEVLTAEDLNPAPTTEEARVLELLEQGESFRTITTLEGQLSGAQAIIERLTEQLRQQTVTPEEEVRLLDFAAKMRDNWDAISWDIESKQAILNRFNIQVELKLVDGKKTAIVTGKLLPDEKLFVVETMTTWLH